MSAILKEYAHGSEAFRHLFGSLLLLVASSLTTAASAAVSPTVDRALDRYATPDQLVAIQDGRRINLRCSGSGPQTVLLEAGAHATSMTWSSLQPRVARFARVCAYDRAGFGFSDEGPLPRDLDATSAICTP